MMSAAVSAPATTSKDEVLVTLTGYLTEMFELSPKDITPEAMLADDLGLDSIDAVDLMVRLQDYTGRKVPAAAFKTVRTVGDVVDQVHALLASQG
jgi:acyl carrier protein